MMNNDLHIKSIEKSGDEWTVTTTSVVDGVRFGGEFLVCPERAYTNWYEPVGENASIVEEDGDDFVVVSDGTTVARIHLDDFHDLSVEARKFAVEAIVRLEKDIENTVADLIAKAVA